MNQKLGLNFHFTVPSTVKKKRRASYNFTSLNNFFEMVTLQPK